MKILGFEIKRTGRQEKFSIGDPDVRQRVAFVGHQPYYIWDTGDGFDSSKADRIDANFSRAVRLIGDSISGLPVILKEELETEEGVMFKPVADHPLIELLRRPNPFNRFDELLRHIVQGLMGNGEICLMSPLKNGLPSELWPAPPGIIQVNLGKNGIPIGYKRWNGQTFVPINEKEEAVLHFRLYDMRTPFQGQSLVGPIKDEMQLNRNALQWHDQHFRTGAHSEMYLKDTSAAGLSPEQREEMIASVASAVSGLNRKDKVPLFPPDIDIITVEKKLREMAYGEMVSLNREQIMSVCGIPMSFISGQWASYASALVDERVIWSLTIIPMKRLIELTFKHQMLDKFFNDDDLTLDLDVSGVPALQEDAVQKAQRLRAACGRPYLTVNEARKEAGQEPIEGGDELSSGVNPFIDVRTDEEARQKFSIEDYLSPSPKPQRLNQWMAFDRRAEENELRYRAIIIKYWKGQRARIIEAVKKKTGSFGFMSALFAVDDSDIFELLFENEQLALLLRPFFKKVIAQEGKKAAAKVGGIFAVDTPEVIEMIEKLVNRSTKINETTWQAIKGLLNDAYEKSWTGSQLTKEIYGLYNEYGYARAQTIARTEMAGVMNSGSMESFRQNGVEKKEWMASLDAATREAHAAADGQVVNIDQPFNVDGEMLMAPGDPNGSAGNTINCRCTILPVID